jgi:hypothetical protein
MYILWTPAYTPGEGQTSWVYSTNPVLHLCRSCYVTQEAKYVERWPNTTSAWAGWSRFDIPVDRYGGVHSPLICTSSILGSPTCHRASQQENTYSTKYQKADRASTLVTLCMYVTVNKPVLSYLSLCLLPQYDNNTSTRSTAAREPQLMRWTLDSEQSATNT